MPTPSSSTASLQRSFDPTNVRSAPASCPPEAERPEHRSPSGEPSDGGATEAARARAPPQQPTHSISSAQHPQPHTTQSRPPTMDSDSDSSMIDLSSTISTISGLSPAASDVRSSSSSGSSEGKDQQDEEDLSPRPLYYADQSITSNPYLSNVRVSRSTARR